MRVCSDETDIRIRMTNHATCTSTHNTDSQGQEGAAVQERSLRKPAHGGQRHGRCVVYVYIYPVGGARAVCHCFARPASLQVCVGDVVVGLWRDVCVFLSGPPVCWRRVLLCFCMPRSWTNSNLRATRDWGLGVGLIHPSLFF
jgi:hypothetical protein